MSTTKTGRQAESAVAQYLEVKGFEVIAQNWRTRWCEIDIVAKRASIIYFVEVKYRKNTTYGDGFAYITPQKQRQMIFAANFWVTQHNWQGDYVLKAASVTGENCDDIELVEIET